MGEKKQNCAEFQMIYVGFTFKEELSSHSFNVGCAKRLPSTVRERGGQRKLIVVVKVGQHCGDESCWEHVPLTACDENGTLPRWSSSPKPITPV